MNPETGRRAKPAAHLRLFCFPNAGGGAALLHSWLNGLPSVIDMQPIHLPGRDRRRAEPPFVHMDALIRDVAGVMESSLDLPFALFGHSVGGLMAFEMARELRRRGLPAPVRLFVSAARAPQTTPSLAPIHHLPYQEFIDALVKRYDAIPAPVLADQELMQIFLPILRADLEILETYAYRPEAPLSCPITVLGGLQDSTVARSQLESWQQQTTDTCELHMFQGNHFFLREARPQILDRICSDLPLRSLIANG